MKVSSRLERLRPVDGPYHLPGLDLAEGLDLGPADHVDDPAHVVPEGERRRDRNATVVGHAVFGVEIPVPAGRLLPVHQDVIAPAHLTVKGLHQKALLPGEHLPEFVAFSQEVLGVGCAGGHRQGRGHVLQLHIQSVFVRQKVLETPETLGLNEMVDVRGNALAVLRVVEPQIDHLMALALEVVREGAHGGEKSRHLLNVVLDIVGLLPDFHDDERHSVVRLREPGVEGVELVPQDQA